MLALVPVCTSNQLGCLSISPSSKFSFVFALASQHYRGILEFSVCYLSLYGKPLWFISSLSSWHLTLKYLAHTLSRCLLNCWINLFLNLHLIASGDGHWESDWPESGAWKGGWPCTPQTPEPGGPRNGCQAAPTRQAQSSQVRKPGPADLGLLGRRSVCLGDERGLVIVVSGDWCVTV